MPCVPTVAILSDGAGNSAWYEHRTIAEGAGLLLAEPHECTVLRLEVPLADLRASAGGPPRRAGRERPARSRCRDEPEQDVATPSSLTAAANGTSRSPSLSRCEACSSATLSSRSRSSWACCEAASRQLVTPQRAKAQTAPVGRAAGRLDHPRQHGTCRDLTRRRARTVENDISGAGTKCRPCAPVASMGQRRGCLDACSIPMSTVQSRT